MGFVRKTVKIISDGTQAGTHVYDSETGREMVVQEIEWSYHIDSLWPSVRITLPLAEIEWEGEARVIWPGHKKDKDGS